ncbi:MAG: BlaI/MecI/CopY family transcriptional regulator [Roseburia sp.]|nr:BlaI/MecI/CopY family transcriptional regulator [Roseburia sp.]
MEYKLGEIEMKFAQLIWEHEPLSSGELARLSEAALHWKKSTTYTILRRLCDRGLFRNEDGVVTSNVSLEEFLAKRSEQFVEDTFQGSLPRFLAAFTSGRRLSDKEVEELRKIIEENGGEACDDSL